VRCCYWFDIYIYIYIYICIYAPPNSTELEYLDLWLVGQMSSSSEA
jgi:hypothetical protein